MDQNLHDLRLTDCPPPDDPDPAPPGGAAARARMRHFVEGVCHLAAAGTTEALELLGCEAFDDACRRGGMSEDDATEARIEVLSHLIANGDREAAQVVLDVLGGQSIHPGALAELYARLVRGALPTSAIARLCGGSRMWAHRALARRAA